MVNWKDRDWPLIIVVVIAVVVVTAMIIANYQLRSDNAQLQSGVGRLDSLLTIYQTQLTACRADRDTLGFAVVSMFRALPIQFTEVNYERKGN